MIILCLDENINVLSCNMYIFWHSVSQSASKHLCIWSNSYFHLWQDKPRSGLYEPFYSQRWSKNLRAARQPDTSIFLTYSYWEDYWVSDPSACTTSLVFLTWTQIYLNFSSVSAVLFRPKGAGEKKRTIIRVFPFFAMIICVLNNLSSWELGGWEVLKKWQTKWDSSSTRSLLC